ncbi:MAG: ribosome-associated translation inhibitor RaiA [Actinomycetales bacterium]|nr:ribosome-associated translation inhibitor RaiA [Actinomycetales bacterium]
MKQQAQQNISANVDVVIHGRHFSISEKFKAHVTAKLARTSKFGLPVHRIDVEVSHANNPRQSARAFEVKLTADGIGPFIRAHEFAADQYTAFDLVLERFEEQLRRMHERSKSIKHHRPSPSPALEFQAAAVISDHQRAELPSQSAQSTEVTLAQPAGSNLAGISAVISQDNLDVARTSNLILHSGPLQVELTHPQLPKITVEQAVERLVVNRMEFLVFIDSETQLPSVIYPKLGYDYGLVQLGNAS